MNSILRCAGVTTVILAFSLVAAVACAQDDFDFWPNANYDPAIPTVEDVLGCSPGERITWHRDAVRYFEALADAESGRTGSLYETSSVRLSLINLATLHHKAHLFHHGNIIQRVTRHRDDIGLFANFKTSMRITNFQEISRNTGC